MHVTRVMEKECMNFKKNKEGYMYGFGGSKGKRYGMVWEEIQEGKP